MVIFGLGVQSKTQSLDDAIVTPAAIDLMQYLGERCRVVGVRGEFTKQVFAHFAGVENTYVTGCPSLYSHPSGVKKMYHAWKHGKSGLRAYAGTNYSDEVERQMLFESTQRNQFLVEPVSKANFEFFLDANANVNAPDMRVPYYLKRYIKNDQTTVQDLADYYSKYFRLFRNIDTWLEFYQDQVSFSYGSRFHVNMASLLAGVPALWLTHDARTSELVEFMHLPSLAIADAAQMSPEEIQQAWDPEDFFDNIHGLYDNFNEYLGIFGLPPVYLDF